MAQVTLTDIQGVALGPVSAVDAKGNPTALAGPLTWGVSDASILAIVPSEDGLSAQLSAVGALGNAQATVTDGVLTGSVDFSVIASAEASLSIPVGTPA